MQEANAELKIADFGLAQLVKQGDKLMSGRGTPEYVAPEVGLLLHALLEHRKAREGETDLQKG